MSTPRIPLFAAAVCALAVRDAVAIPPAGTGLLRRASLAVAGDGQPEREDLHGHEYGDAMSEYSWGDTLQYPMEEVHAPKYEDLYPQYPMEEVHAPKYEDLYPQGEHGYLNPMAVHAHQHGDLGYDMDHPHGDQGYVAQHPMEVHAHQYGGLGYDADHPHEDLGHVAQHPYDQYYGDVGYPMAAPSDAAGEVLVADVVKAAGAYYNHKDLERFMGAGQYSIGPPVATWLDHGGVVNHDGSAHTHGETAAGLAAVDHHDGSTKAPSGSLTKHDAKVQEDASIKAPIESSMKHAASITKHPASIMEHAAST